MSRATTLVDTNSFSQDEVNNILSLSGVAIWEYSMETKEVKFSDNWFTLLGYSPGELPERLSTFFALIHPADLFVLKQATNKYLADRTLQVLDVEYRLKTKDGRWKWLRNRSSLAVDINNQPIKWLGSVINISRLKVSENLVLRKNQHLNSVVNSLSDIVYEINSEYKFINCWVPKTHPLHSTIRSYAGKFVSEVFSPTVFKYFKKLVDSTVETGKPQVFEYYAQASNKYFLARTTLIKESDIGTNHVSMVIQDITSYELTRIELKKKEANLTAMIQNTSDVFWAIDKDEKLIVFNEAFDQLYSGISNHRPVEGEKLNDDFLLKETAKRWRLIHSRSIQGLDTEFSKHVIFKNGDVRLFEFHINPFKNQSGEIIGSVVTGRDIDDIYTAKKQAEKSARLKSKFVSTISHEIRTPLNAILGTCHQLERNNKQQNLQEDLDILHMASDNLLSLINDVLDFTKLESGKITIKPTTFNLTEFLKAFDQFTRNLAAKKNLNLTTEFDHSLPEYIQIDKTKLHQILTNLLSNAVKYTNNGNIIFKVQLLHRTEKKSTILFSISDTGIGIPEKELNGVFDSFTQSSTSYQMLMGGTGLGLSITKNLVELLNGKIKVESIINKGSNFTVELPIANSSHNHQQNRKQKAEGSLDNIHILVAEDNEINAKIITRLLGQWNANYQLATNGLIATEMSQLKKYDLILMDIQMPLKNGFEASGEIRSYAQSLNKETPIIALTAQPDFSFDPSYRDGLFDGYILKPFHPDVLKENIIDFLTM